MIDNMPGYVVTRVAEHLNRRRLAVNGSRVLLIGLTFKRNSGDARQSPAIVVAGRLKALGAELRAVEPRLAAAEMPDGVELVACETDEVAAADVIVALTDHDDIDWDLTGRHAGRLLDTRNELPGSIVDGSEGGPWISGDGVGRRQWVS